MSHPVNTAILEQIGEDVAELTTDALMAELGLTPDIGAGPLFANDAVVISGSVVTRDELEDRVGTKRFEEWPDGPF